jgi:hypothetical protein
MSGNENKMPEFQTQEIGTKSNVLLMYDFWAWILGHMVSRQGGEKIGEVGGEE